MGTFFGDLLRGATSVFKAVVPGASQAMGILGIGQGKALAKNATDGLQPLVPIVGKSGTVQYQDANVTLEQGQNAGSDIFNKMGGSSSGGIMGGVKGFVKSNPFVAAAIGAGTLFFLNKKFKIVKL